MSPFSYFISHLSAEGPLKTSENEYVKQQIEQIRCY